MKSIIFTLFLLITLAAVLLPGCARTIEPQPIVQPRFVDVYYTGECLPTTLAKNAFIENLWVYPGDSVAFINTTDKEIELNFPAGIFEKENVIILPGKRVILKVIAVEPKASSLTLKDENCPDGVPKVQVGEEP